MTGAKVLHDTWLCSCCKGVCEEVQPTQHVLLLPVCSVAWPTMHCVAQVPAKLQKIKDDLVKAAPTVSDHNITVDTQDAIEPRSSDDFHSANAVSATSSGGAAAVFTASEWLSLEDAIVS